MDESAGRRASLDFDVVIVQTKCRERTDNRSNGFESKDSSFNSSRCLLQCLKMLIISRLCQSSHGLQYGTSIPIRESKHPNRDPAIIGLDTDSI